MSTTMPRSALRHRPISQEIPEFVVLTPRSRHQQTVSRIQTRNQHPLLIVGLSMLGTFLLLWAIGNLIGWGSIQLDTLRYGYPRTVQLDHVVGHGGLPSHFIAWNEQGQAYILEVPDADPRSSHLLLGPKLVGPGADLTPLSLSFVGNPHHPDLLLQVQGILTRFRNTGTSYVP